VAIVEMMGMLSMLITGGSGERKIRSVEQYFPHAGGSFTE